MLPIYLEALKFVAQSAKGPTPKQFDAKFGTEVHEFVAPYLDESKTRITLTEKGKELLKSFGWV